MTPPRPEPEDAVWWERLAGVIAWYVLPGIAISIVVAYVALAVAWDANPPAIPVTGHSMQPKLYAGDLVFVHGVDPKTLKKGDIIAFRTTKDMQKKYDVPSEYVHRIVAISKAGSGGGRMFHTKGDNVAGPDPFWTYDRDVVGIYKGKISGAGYPLLFFRSKQGKIFGAAVLAVLVLYFLFGIWERRQEAMEMNALSMAQVVAEARELRDSMLTAATGARGPPVIEAQARPVEPEPEPEPADDGTHLLPVEGEPPPGAVLCSQGCHVLLPGARFDPHTGDRVEIPGPQAPEVSALDDVSEPAYVPVWERPRQNLAEFELAPAYVEEAATEIVPPAAPEPPAIDFERLEREIHEAAAANRDVQETMRDLVGAVGEYGEHLRSHTAAVQNLAASSGDLAATTQEMRQFLASLTTLLTALVQQQQQQPPQA